MRLLISTAIALTAALVAAGPTAGVGAAPSNRPKDIKVIVTFQDGGGDRIQSDGVGVYQDGIGGVVAYIAASDNGQLIFSTNAFNTAGRTLQFFFHDNCLLALAQCANPWPELNERSGILANALTADRTVLIGGLTAMTPGGPDLPLWAKFDIPLDSDPAFWNVCFDSRKVVGPCGAAPGGTSTDAHVRRDARDTWTVYANSTDRADLVRDSQTRKSRTFSLAGTYAMPFSFTVQCVNAADCP